jgi:hypothetical protein
MDASDAVVHGYIRARAPRYREARGYIFVYLSVYKSTQESKIVKLNLPAQAFSLAYERSGR